MSPKVTNNLAFIASMISQYPKFPTREAEYAVAVKAKRGNKRARKLMLLHNLGLAVSVAVKYQGCGVDLEDLVQFGLLGLEKAVDKFDPHKGFRFSTYAVWWIRSFVRRAVTGDGSVEMIAVLDSPIGDDTTKTMLDEVVDTRPLPSEEVEEQRRLLHFHGVIGEIIGVLRPIEQDILQSRLMSVGTPDTLEVLGDRWGLSRERIRQLENGIIRRLKPILARRLNLADWQIGKPE